MELVPVFQGHFRLSHVLGKRWYLLAELAQQKWDRKGLVGVPQGWLHSCDVLFDVPWGAAPCIHLCTTARRSVRSHSLKKGIDRVQSRQTEGHEGGRGDG